MDATNALKQIRPRDKDDIVTRDEDGMPKKKYFRSRAHCNPLSHNDSFDYPSR